MTSDEMKLINGELFSTLTREAGFGVGAINRERKVVTANRSATDLLGYSLDELLNMDITNLVPVVRKTDVERQMEVIFKRNCKKRLNKVMYMELVAKDGNLIPVRFSLSCFNFNEVRVLGVFFSRSVSVADKALQLPVGEHRIKQLIERAPVAVAMFDNSMRYMHVSDRWKEDFQLGTADIKGVSHYTMFPDLPERWKEMHRRGLKGETIRSDEDFFIHADGRKEWLRWELWPWHKTVNTIGGIIMFCEIITARKVAEADLRRSHTELEEMVRRRTSELQEALVKANEVNQLKSEFITMASHEFRTPLSTILSSAAIAEIYRETGEQDKRQRHYARIRSSVTHLVNILEDFFFLERLEQNKVSVTNDAFDLRELLQEVAGEMQKGSKHDQTVRLEYHGNDSVLQDRETIRQVMSKLLSNAIKYSRNNIELIAIVDDNVIRLEVADQGIGIPKDQQPHIYDKFFRCDNALNAQGTGLGLSIVKHCVDLLNGSIHSTANEPQGTRFMIELPVHA